jgi:hypothetical protein
MSTPVPLINARLGNPKAKPIDPTQTTKLDDDLSSYILSCFDTAKDNRQTSGINDRLLAAMRSMRGEYDAQSLAAIRQFGGSEVYARITATKVRTLAAALREVYSAAPRPWTVVPTPVPELKRSAEDVDLVETMIAAEVAEVVAANGAPPSEALIADRREKITSTIAEAKLKQARDAAELRELQIDDVLVEGRFYDALWGFHFDLALFPIACIKGPVVRYQNVMKWGANGIPTVERIPKMLYEKPSPFDLYFAPWAHNPQEGYIIHRQSVTQQELESLRGLPSYSTERIDDILAAGPSSMTDWDSYCEVERRQLESRQTTDVTSNSVEKPWAMLEFHGAVPGYVLQTWGEIPGVTDFSGSLDITCWMVNKVVIGVRRNPHPMGKKPFYISSYEKVPGSLYGNAIPDILEDIQGVSNACLRALTNNMSMASGPQVIRNEDRFAPNQDGANMLWPWKVWDVVDSMFTNQSSKPLEFFQPDSNAAELLSVFQAFATLADDVSSIPRYMAGGTGGQIGALRTASGLSMMMDAANRTIKQVIGAVDREVITPAVEDVNVYLALTRPDLSVGGDIEVRALGSQELLSKETLRMRRMEFLQATANPIDQALVGPEGRAAILRETAKDLGLPADMIVKPNAAQQAIAQQATLAPQPGAPAPAPAEEGAEPADPTAGVARGPTT